MSHPPPTIPLSLLVAEQKALLQRSPRHVALVVLGLKRWEGIHGTGQSNALAVGLKVLTDVIYECVDQRMQCVTLYLFSHDICSDRGPGSPDMLPIFLRFLGAAANNLHVKDVRFHMHGSVEQLSAPLANWVHALEQRTSKNSGMRLEVVLDGQASVMNGDAHSNDWEAQYRLDSETGVQECALDTPELVIRTGGRVPLHCAMVWDTSETALYFTDLPWPDFSLSDFDAALGWFRLKDRRAGTQLIKTN